MEPIPETYKTNGYTYALVDNKPLNNGDILAIYHQTRPGFGTTDRYEVLLLHYQKTKTINNTTVAPGWRIPRNEDFGKTGWSVQGLDTAHQKLNTLSKKLDTNDTKKVVRQGPTKEKG